MLRIDEIDVANMGLLDLQLLGDGGVEGSKGDGLDEDLLESPQIGFVVGKFTDYVATAFGRDHPGHRRYAEFLGGDEICSVKGDQLLRMEEFGVIADVLPEGSLQLRHILNSISHTLLSYVVPEARGLVLNISSDEVDLAHPQLEGGEVNGSILRQSVLTSRPTSRQRGDGHLEIYES